MYDSLSLYPLILTMERCEDAKTMLVIPVINKDEGDDEQW